MYDHVAVQVTRRAGSPCARLYSKRTHISHIDGPVLAQFKACRNGGILLQAPVTPIKRHRTDYKFQRPPTHSPVALPAPMPSVSAQGLVQFEEKARAHKACPICPPCPDKSPRSIPMSGRSQFAVNTSISPPHTLPCCVLRFLALAHLKRQGNLRNQRNPDLPMNCWLRVQQAQLLGCCRLCLVQMSECEATTALLRNRSSGPPLRLRLPCPSLQTPPVRKPRPRGGWHGTLQLAVIAPPAR